MHGASRRDVELVSPGINLDPANPIRHNNLGDLYVIFGEYSKAESAYRYANDLQPDQTDARIEWVGMHLLQGNRGDVAVARCADGESASSSNIHLCQVSTRKIENQKSELRYVRTNC